MPSLFDVLLRDDERLLPTVPDFLVEDVRLEAAAARCVVRPELFAPLFDAPLFDAPLFDALPLAALLREEPPRELLLFGVLRDDALLAVVPRADERAEVLEPPRLAAPVDFLAVVEREDDFAADERDVDLAAVDRLPPLRDADFDVPLDDLDVPLLAVELRDDELFAAVFLAPPLLADELRLDVPLDDFAAVFLVVPDFVPPERDDDFAAGFARDEVLRAPLLRRLVERFASVLDWFSVFSAALFSV